MVYRCQQCGYTGYRDVEIGDEGELVWSCPISGCHSRNIFPCPYPDEDIKEDMITVPEDTIK